MRVKTAEHETEIIRGLVAGYKITKLGKLDKGWGSEPMTQKNNCKALLYYSFLQPWFYCS